MLELAGRGDIPVYAGADAPFIRGRDVAAHVHGESGLDGPDLHPQHAARRACTRSIPRRRIPCASAGDAGRAGPLTNIGLAFATHEDARPERIVLMGGAVGDGNGTPAAEFNI